MASDDSRKIPTMQAKEVGNIRLAMTDNKSDISAMPSAPIVRQTIQRVLDRTKVGPVEAIEIIKNNQGVEFGRDYLRDFMEDRKQSLAVEFCQFFSAEFGIGLENLLVTKRRVTRQKSKSA